MAIRRITRITVTLLAVMISVVIGQSVGYCESSNIVHFKTSGNELVYQTDNEVFDRFIHFADMAPGDSYHNTLTINNDTKYTYQFYLQAADEEKSEEEELLLKSTLMKLTYEGTTLYDGTAAGTYACEGDLTDVVYLGEYAPGEIKTIDADLMLDINYEPAEESLETTTDWIIWAVREEEPPRKVTPTGDNNMLLLSVSGLLIAALLFVLIIRGRRKNG